MLKSGSFNLRKFIINSPTLQEKINNAEGLATTGYQYKQSSDLNEIYAKSILGSTQQVQPGEQNILGVSWNVASDRFLFNLSGIARLATELDPTKRNIVSLVGRFYDPFGYLSPITIRLKVLIQDLCELKIDWDQPLDGAILSKWQALISDLQEAHTSE